MKAITHPPDIRYMYKTPMNFDTILKFLKGLAKNNNREWFEKNKRLYQEAKENFEDFLEELHKEMLKFDDNLGGLNPRKLAFRIYRDVRFGKDKSPYKINMGAGLSPGGKMIQEPGYYIHIEPGNKSFLAAGMYMPDSTNLSKVRQEIDYNPKRFLKILNDRNFKKYFKELDDFDKVKTAPRGYAKDHLHIELLKNKSYIVSCYFSDTQVKDKKFVRLVVQACKVVKPLKDFLSEAIN